MAKKSQSIEANSEQIPANAAEYKKGFRKWLPLIVLSLAMMIIIIDTTVLNVSLRTIVDELNTDLQGIQWVITAYALTLAALTITGGRLGDLFGRKRMFILGAVIFAVGSFITSISHSVGTMIVGESIIEGVGAALMMPATASLLVANYKGKDRAIAFGVWGGIAGASAAIGPILGGFFTTNFSWRWAFRINIVVVLVLLAGAWFIAESRDRKAKRELDIVGIILSAGGLLAFVYGIIEASTYGWWLASQPYAVAGKQLLSGGGLSISPIMMGLGVVLLALFAFWEKHVEKKGRTPLVSLRIFLNKQFTSGTATISLMSLGMTGIIFAVPVFLQSVQNLNALQTGLALLPLSLAVLIVAPGSAALTKFFTPKRLIQTGLLIGVIASVVLGRSITATSTAADLAPGLALFGIGMGLVFAQASNLTLSAVPVSESGEASGINNTLRQVGSTFGSAIIGAVVLTTMASGLVSGVNNSTVIPEQLKPQISQAVSEQASGIELGGEGSGRASKLPAPIQTELKTIAAEASADSSQQAMLYTGIFMLAAFAVSFLLPNVRDLEKRGTKAPAAAH